MNVSFCFFNGCCNCDVIREDEVAAVILSMQQKAEARTVPEHSVRNAYGLLYLCSCILVLFNNAAVT